MKLARALALGALAGPVCALAQSDVCEGNGIGNVYIAHDAARLGRPVTLRLGSPDHPAGIALLGVSDSPAATFYAPAGGLVCLDLNSPLYRFYVVPLDAAGDGSIRFDAPLDPSLLRAGYAPDRPTRTPLLPEYAHAATVEGALLGISKTVRITWELPQAYHRVGDLVAARAGHTATALGLGPRDNRTRVFLAGGGDDELLAPTATRTTELYDALTRSFSAGPDLAQERTFHTATRLLDGRVLLVGGVDSGGVAQSSCEIYDPSTGLVTGTGSLGIPRLGHQTILLPHGRVLVTGGITDYVDATNRFATVLDTAQRTTELWDPATDLWTPYRDMAFRRSGHVITPLSDGRYLLTGGFSGHGVTFFIGIVVPIYHAGVELFDPTTGAFTATASMVAGRGFHAVTELNDGRVLVSGGLTSSLVGDSHATTATVEIFDGTAFQNVAFVPFAVPFPAFHELIPTADGRARLVGGYGGQATTLQALSFGGTYGDGGYLATGTPLGVNPLVPGSVPSPRGNHTVTKLYDGSYLVAGGAGNGGPLQRAYRYVE